MYEEIGSNKWKSMLMTFLFVVFVVGVGFVIGYAWGGPNRWFIGVAIAAIIAIIMALVGYYQSDSIALAVSGAKPIEDLEQTPEVIRYRNTVEGLAIAAGVPAPRIYLIDSPAMNAFATGRNPDHSAIATTWGLLTRMNDIELQGVIGHEMSHIKNYDILLQTITIVLVGTVILLSDIFLRTFWFAGEDRDMGEAGIWFMVIGIVLAILAPIVAQLIKLAISRKREYLADANGALLTRYPLGLATALEKLSMDDKQLRTANKATAHMFIVQPLKLKSEDKGSWLNRMFDTHPPIEERIARLRKMSGDFVPVGADGQAQAPQMPPQ